MSGLGENVSFSSLPENEIAKNVISDREIDMNKITLGDFVVLLSSNHDVTKMIDKESAKNNKDKLNKGLDSFRIPSRKEQRDAIKSYLRGFLIQINKEYGVNVQICNFIKDWYGFIKWDTMIYGNEIPKHCNTLDKRIDYIIETCGINDVIYSTKKFPEYYIQRNHKMLENKRKNSFLLSCND